jgi:hypothetical protein
VFFFGQGNAQVGAGKYRPSQNACQDPQGQEWKPRSSAMTKTNKKQPQQNMITKKPNTSTHHQRDITTYTHFRTDENTTGPEAA